ncbi:hypothetical protein [Haloplanus sp. C73]|uniref:hypothetical protein n=1 Tax=Haloplanus sp. C73 TaxID=3421641 RepID=UPI003EC11BA7
MSRTVAANKRAGERVETHVVSRVTELNLVPDDVAIEYDAVATTAVYPASDLPMVGLCVVNRGTPVEIKSVVRRMSTGERGRFYLRPEQHKALVDAGGVYLFAVCTSDDRDVLALKIVPATVLEDLIPSWLDGGDGRSDYSQLAWTNVFDVCEVEERGRP